MKIAIVEDNSLLCANLAQTLTGVPGCTVLATYSTAEHALTGLRALAVDLLLIDIELPGLSGIELIQRLRDGGSEVPMLVWTIHEDRDLVYAALKAGAVGYLLKGCDAHELEASLREVAAGGAPMSPSIARRLMQEFVVGVKPPPEVDLTVQERRVLRGIAAGLSYKEIAAEHGLSPHTIHTHVKHVYAKLHAHGRSKALQQARKIGLITGS